jgi:hypothetical protein
MKCPECNHENQSTTRYCTRCGQQMGAAPSGGGQVRKTAGMEDMFDAPQRPSSPYAPPPPPAVAVARPAGPQTGQVRKTILEDEPAGTGAAPPLPSMPAYAVSAMPAAPAMPGAARRPKTELDESPLPVAGPAHPGAPAPMPAAAPGTARIVGWMVSFDRNGAGQDYPIRAGRTRIGRARDNEVSLFFEPKASDIHATIIWRNGNTAVKDEGSTNGTFVNGEDIGIGQVQPLASGDALTVGGSTFLVFLVDTEKARSLWPQSAWAA